MGRVLRTWAMVLLVVIAIWLVLFFGVTLGGWRLLP
ncbi:hypothetical protein HRbin26_01607 [bacterium HR26]|nr:hypothetical protein HRbin26_01607 [bacterium HR26]